ncbi:MAG: hypothetical protein WD845_08775 [Pirellulales bacterium]
MSLVLRSTALGIALVCLVGCKLVDEQPKGRSPLAPVTPSPDQVTLEVFSAPAPLEDPRWAALWSEVDEQSLSPELRTRLAQNGLRAGVIGARVPDALASLLKVTDERVSDEERTKVPLDGKPSVVMRLMQPSPGKRHELILTGVRNRLSLLRSAGGEVIGKTYSQAEGRLAMHVFPQPGGQVRLELVPELHHGEPKTQTRPSDGMFIWTTERDKEVFAELKVDSVLAAGEMLLITCLDDRPGSIGHHLFVQTDGEAPLRTLWALRVAQAGADRAFVDWNAERPAPLTPDAGDRK